MEMSLKRRGMAFAPFLLPIGWNAVVVVGVEAAILDFEVNLRIEAI